MAAPAFRASAGSKPQRRKARILYDDRRALVRANASGGAGPPQGADQGPRPAARGVDAREIHRPALPRAGREGAQPLPPSLLSQRRMGVPRPGADHRHSLLPRGPQARGAGAGGQRHRGRARRSEEHTSELQSQFHLVCRLLLEKKKKNINLPKKNKKKKNLLK